MNLLIFLTSCSFFSACLTFIYLLFSNTKKPHTKVKDPVWRSAKLIRQVTFQPKDPKVKSNPQPAHNRIPNKKIADFVNGQLRFRLIAHSLRKSRSLFEIFGDCSYRVRFKVTLMLAFSCPCYENWEFWWFGKIGLLQSIKWSKSQ